MIILALKMKVAIDTFVDTVKIIDHIFWKYPAQRCVQQKSQRRPAWLWSVM